MISNSSLGRLVNNQITSQWHTGVQCIRGIWSARKYLQWISRSKLFQPGTVLSVSHELKFYMFTGLGGGMKGIMYFSSFEDLVWFFIGVIIASVIKKYYFGLTWHVYWCVISTVWLFDYLGVLNFRRQSTLSYLGRNFMQGHGFESH